MRDARGVKVSRSVVLGNRHGLHVRPAGLVVKEARRFASEIALVHGEVRSSAKALLEVMLLAVPPGGTVLVEAEGDDAEAAAAAVASVLASLPGDS